jgi:hypothetical protein
MDGSLVEGDVHPTIEHGYEHTQHRKHHTNETGTVKEVYVADQGERYQGNQRHNENVQNVHLNAYVY